MIKLKIFNTLGMLAMVYVNYLANALPINGYTTGALSVLYPNLFVPAGVTFSIWGIIYILLIGFTVLQWLPSKAYLVEKIGYAFLLSCTLNISWILVWHYQLIELSVVVMLMLLVSLYTLFTRTQSINGLSLVEKLFSKLPFSIYFGWLCVATIANITALLVSYNFSPPNPEYWVVGLIIITQLLVFAVSKKYKSWGYTAVVIWAIGGIILKQTMSSGPQIIVITGYVAILFSMVITLRQIHLK